MDATREAVPGLVVRRLQPATSGQRSDSHTFGPEHLLALAGALYGHVPETHMLLLPARNFQFGEGLSSVTALAAERALCFLDRRLRQPPLHAG